MLKTGYFALKRVDALVVISRVKLGKITDHLLSLRGAVLQNSVVFVLCLRVQNDTRQGKSVFFDDRNNQLFVLNNVTVERLNRRSGFVVDEWFHIRGDAKGNALSLCYGCVIVFLFLLMNEGCFVGQTFVALQFFGSRIYEIAELIELLKALTQPLPTLLSDLFLNRHPGYYCSSYCACDRESRSNDRLKPAEMKNCKTNESGRQSSKATCTETVKVLHPVVPRCNRNLTKCADKRKAQPLAADLPMETAPQPMGKAA